VLGLNQSSVRELDLKLPLFDPSRRAIVSSLRELKRVEVLSLEGNFTFQPNSFDSITSLPSNLRRLHIAASEVTLSDVMPFITLATPGLEELHLRASHTKMTLYGRRFDLTNDERRVLLERALNHPASLRKLRLEGVNYKYYDEEEADWQSFQDRMPRAVVMELIVL
jgi:hypothetical protein